MIPTLRVEDVLTLAPVQLGGDRETPDEELSYLPVGQRTTCFGVDDSIVEPLAIRVWSECLGHAEVGKVSAR